MHPVFLPRGHSATTVPVTFVNAATWRDLRGRLDARARAFADAAGFEPKAGRHLLLPAADGGLAGVLFALEAGDDAGKDLFWPGALAPLLPAGAYRFANAPHDSRLAALAFALGSYRFTRYRKQDGKDREQCARACSLGLESSRPVEFAHAFVLDVIPRRDVLRPDRRAARDRVIATAQEGTAHIHPSNRTVRPT